MARAELPKVLQLAHEDLHEEMVKATLLGGETGTAAKAVVKVLFPHVLVEKEFALPPLTLLPRLAKGEISPDVERVLRRTEVMKTEFPRMLEDHKLIVEARLRFLRVATAENSTPAMPGSRRD